MSSGPFLCRFKSSIEVGITSDLHTDKTLFIFFFFDFLVEWGTLSCYKKLKNKNYKFLWEYFLLTLLQIQTGVVFKSSVHYSELCFLSKRDSLVTCINHICSIRLKLCYNYYYVSNLIPCNKVIIFIIPQFLLRSANKVPSLTVLSSGHLFKRGYF